jgi:3-carboxy-cis,cis-muconate cycloisomerase
MSFSPLDSDLLGPLFTTECMREVFSERRFLASMLRVEEALARAQAGVGLVHPDLPGAIANIDMQLLEPAALALQTRLAGVPAIPFVKVVQSALPPELAGGFHYGATTQDIVDTAAVLQFRAAIDLIEADLRTTIVALLRLAEKHCETPCVGRTASQHAAPITFGYKVAGWCVALADQLSLLGPLKRRVQVASLGGPVGTSAAMGEKADAVLAAFSADLGLTAPAIAWHTHRGRIAELGSWLAILLGCLAKMATDIVHLASTEVGEVSEPEAPGRGGSSAMPHKRNPIGSMIILSQHMAAGAHLSVLVTAMASAHERPVGAWHSEWMALPSLFGLAAGALHEASILSEGIEVREDRMMRNLQMTDGLIFSDAAMVRLAQHLGRAEAYAVVEGAVAQVLSVGGTLQGHLIERLPAYRDTIAFAFEYGLAVQASAARCRAAVQHARRQIE